MRSSTTRRACISAVLVAAILVAAGSGCSGLPRRPSVQPTPEPIIRQVADRVLLDFPQPPPFDWGEGTMMGGMMRAGLVLNEPRYIAFVQKWADHWRAHGLDKVLAGSARSPMPGYCGHWGPGFPVVLLYEKTGNPAYLDMARQVASFITTKATRTPEGALGHWGGNYQLWVDTLYMACPLLSHLSRLTSDRAYIQDAVHQLDIFAAHTQDESTGVFWHMYDDPARKRVGVLWGRGNGWVVMSYVEVLGNLDRQSPEYARLLAQFRRQVDGLLRLRDAQTGLWHTVLDRPETYLETSASAMILAALVDARRLELYDPADPNLITHTWSALSAKVDGDGRVFDVSGGTGPHNFETYASKIRGTYTWGTGAFLLAGSALQEAH
jgi:rhamnogalacturonyl hydrolase YesR